MRNSQSDKMRNDADFAICRSLGELNEFKNADLIAAYMPLGKEVDLTGLFANFAEKRFAFPRYVENKENNLPEYEMVEVPGKAFTNNEFDKYFIKGKYGITEPDKGLPGISCKKIDVWLIPGVGFDKSGNRLGRGGGVYDRLLSGVYGFKIGIGYEVQLIQNVPKGSYDQQMDLIITEKQSVRI